MTLILAGNKKNFEDVLEYTYKKFFAVYPAKSAMALRVAAKIPDRVVKALECSTTTSLRALPGGSRIFASNKTLN